MNIQKLHNPQNEREASNSTECKLCEQYLPVLQFYCYKHLYNKNAAKDIAQDILLTVLENLRKQKIRKIDSFSSYIFGVARITCLNENKKSSPISIDAEGHKIDLITQKDEEDWTESEDKKVLHKALSDCMEKLDNLDYNILILSFYQEKSNKEIAQLYHLTQTNVGVRKMRALNKLRYCLESKKEIM